MPSISKEQMEQLLLGNMSFSPNGGEPTYRVDPHTLALQNGWDFDIASPPNLIELKGQREVGNYIVLPDQSQPGYCYVFTRDYAESVYGGEWSTEEEALHHCVQWAEQH